MTKQVDAPRHILEEIVWHKQQEVAQMQQEVSLTAVKNQLSAAPPVRDFLQALQENAHHPSLIAEVKKASPSRGIIRADFDPVAIAQSYQNGGAACLSVLTDEKFFQGSFNNLRLVRSQVSLPLLCKEFIIDPYQIYLARTAGADAVLLIAAILSDRELQNFLHLIHDLGMTALVEVHTLAELDRVLQLDNLHLVGINNRNLEDFTVDLNTTRQLLSQRQQQIQNLNLTVVSESGIYTPADLSFIAEVGARAVLVGESLVKQNDVENAVHILLGKNQQF
ncbi:MAG: indole-3-glycerol phosphate synthase TrpC [Nostoc sp. TH1S01]|nr:indole-3-glycerol phosphate synthase TrpC [Nostoc sp. TH1S01]